MPISTQNHIKSQFTNSQTQISTKLPKIQHTHSHNNLHNQKVNKIQSLTPFYSINPIKKFKSKTKNIQSNNKLTVITHNSTLHSSRIPKIKTYKLSILQFSPQKDQRRWRERERDSLGEVTELAQDTDESSHGDTFQQSFWIISISCSVQLRIRQTELAPYLIPRQRHFSLSPSSQQQLIPNSSTTESQTLILKHIYKTLSL